MITSTVRSSITTTLQCVVTIIIRSIVRRGSEKFCGGMTLNVHIIGAFVSEVLCRTGPTTVNIVLVRHVERSNIRI